MPPPSTQAGASVSGLTVAGSTVAGVTVSGTGTTPKSGMRESFSAEELAIVMSHFDIGVIDSVIDYPKGSRKAPKLLIVSEQGKFLLKRRARGKDDPYKVAFSHALQLYLASKQFPLPHLVGTKKDNNSMLQWRNGIYELFEYIPGQNYPQTLEATFEAGRVLSLYHKLLHEFKSEWQPGNMLFRDNHVVAVIDYDSARNLPRIIDVANGALQFSIIGGDEDVTRWPEYLDESRFKRFLRGYDEVNLLSEAEIKVIPWLMVEALIAEAVFPIAATGSFGKLEGLAFLHMVQRKIH